MKTQFAVFHIEKGKGGGSGIGNHIDRLKPVLNANPAKAYLNRWIVANKEGYILSKKPPQQLFENRIKQRIEEGYRGKKTIRKDAVRFLNVMLTGSHDQMKEIEKDPISLKSWIKTNLGFLEQEFGKENIVSISLHLDEHTPHLHATVVPLTEDGRLSAKKVMGDRNAMSERQTRYGEKMAKFGLKRGLKGSRTKHESVKEYYARLNEAEDILKKPINEDFVVTPEVDKLLTIFINETKHKAKREKAQFQKGKQRGKDLGQSL